MCPSPYLSAALLALASLAPAGAADLSRIDRTLKDEPKYHTKTPSYCLVVFGPEARTQVWLVRDGDRMHVLDSPDGKSPRRWRAAQGQYSNFELGDIRGEDGRTKYSGLRCYAAPNWNRLEVRFGREVQHATRDRNGRLEFATSAKDAPVVHFHGPLAMTLFHNQRPILTGKRVSMTASVGTPGLGKGTFACIDCSDYPKDCWPVAVVEYPAKDGGKPIVDKFTLDDD